MFKKFLNHRLLLVPVVFTLVFVGYTNWSFGKAEDKMAQREFEMKSALLDRYFDNISGAEEKYIEEISLWSLFWDNNKGVYSRLYREDGAVYNPNAYIPNARNDITILDTKIYEYTRVFPQFNPTFTFYFALSPSIYFEDFTQDKELLVFGLSILVFIYFSAWIVHLNGHKKE